MTGSLTTLWLCALAFDVCAFEPDVIFQRVSPAVWTVKADRGNGVFSVGSAVAVTPAALVTTCHIVEGATSAVISHGTTAITVTLIARGPDPSRDLCVLDTSTPFRFQAVEIAPIIDGVRVGERV